MIYFLTSIFFPQASAPEPHIKPLGSQTASVQPIVTGARLPELLRRCGWSGWLEQLAAVPLAQVREPVGRCRDEELESVCAVARVPARWATLAQQRRPTNPKSEELKSWLVSCHFSTGDMLGPPLADVPLPPTSSIGPQGEHPSLPTPLPPSSSTSSSLSSSSSSSSSSSCSSSEAKEQKKSGAKKKCLYNFQDAFMETNRVVMATSASTSSVSCTATTVQSSNNPPIHLASKRPNSLGNLGCKSSG